MATNKQTTRRISFQQCNDLAPCPYCKADLGEPCRNTYQGKPFDGPHPSRARAAFDALKPKRKRTAMPTEPEVPPQPMAELTAEFSVGDRVRLLDDIWDDGCDNHHPPGYFARRGEIVIVRKVDPGHEFPFCVSHEQITDQSFRVAANEIRKESHDG